MGRKTVLTTLGPRFVEAIAYLAIMGLGLGAYLTQVDGVSYIDFIAPGIAASAVMFGAILETSYNAFVRIHVRRVFEAAITTPLSVGDVVVGEYLWGATRGTIYGIVFLIVMAPFGLIASWWALLCPLVFLIGALTFAVIGMTYTSYTSNIEHFNIFWTGVMTPMFLFGGIFFPFTQLPDWAQVIGWLLPLSHFVAATRELVMGDVGWVTAGHVAVLMAFTAVLFWVPVRRLSRTLLA